jgi:hypothetical protein
MRGRLLVGTGGRLARLRGRVKLEVVERYGSPLADPPFDVSSHVLWIAFLLRISAMATRSAPPAKHRTPETGKRHTRVKPAVIVDTNTLLQWLETFDARMMDLALRQQILLRDLGIEPVSHKAAPESLPELA